MVPRHLHAGLQDWRRTRESTASEGRSASTWLPRRAPFQPRPPTPAGPPAPSPPGTFTAGESRLRPPPARSLLGVRSAGRGLQRALRHLLRHRADRAVAGGDRAGGEMTATGTDMVVAEVRARYHA